MPISHPGNNRTGSQAGVTLLELLIVMMIIGVIAGVSFPALTSGMASVRLASASGSLASFLTSAMNRVERREEPAAIVVTPRENLVAVFTAASGDKPAQKLELPAGIFVDAGMHQDESTRYMLSPGGAFPRMTIVLRNEKGARRSVKIDPTTGVPQIERVDNSR